MKFKPKVAIVYLYYWEDLRCVKNMVAAMQELEYPKELLELVIVSNFHEEKTKDFETYLKNVVLPLSGGILPHITYLPQKENFCFAGGNNMGAGWAIENKFDYVFFHNGDGYLAPNAISELVKVFHDEKVAIAQSLVLLEPQHHLVNTAGNCFHFLGLGYASEEGKVAAELLLPEVREISYASGAAFMIAVPLIKKYGGWDSDFFMYHEDLEWSLRLRTYGYKIVLASKSMFYHEYTFATRARHFFWMERNRFAVLIMFYKWRTLVLLLPMLLILELGLIVFSIKKGWFDTRKAVYSYWWKKENRALWFEKRKYIQKHRLVSDRLILKYAVATIPSQQTQVKNLALTFIGNPLMVVYYYFLRLIIWW